MSGGRIWFAAGPPEPKETQDGQDSRRQFAVVDGYAWLIEQAPIHQAQQERPYEAAVMPHSFLNSATYTLSTHGWTISDDLRAITLERDAPLETVMPKAEASLVRIGDRWVLGHQYSFGEYRSVAAIFENEWLFVFWPSRAAQPLELTHGVRPH
jgi:hypothetical protein